MFLYYGTKRMEIWWVFNKNLSIICQTLNRLILSIYVIQKGYAYQLIHLYTWICFKLSRLWNWLLLLLFVIAIRLKQCTISFKFLKNTKEQARTHIDSLLSFKLILQFCKSAKEFSVNGFFLRNEIFCELNIMRHWKSAK